MQRIWSVDDFRHGIDRRRGAAVGAPGTLWDARNVHVTPGGDLEKRRGLAPVPNAVLPSGVIGLHALGERLWVFGSDDLGSLFPLPSDPPIHYQRLQHSSNPAARLVAIHKAVNYAGLIYAIAEFEGGLIGHFYDGVQVADWEVITAPVTTNAAILSKLQAMLSESERFLSVSVSGDDLIVTMNDYVDHTAAAGVEHLGAPTSGSFVVLSKTTPVVPVTGAEAVGIITFVSRGSSGAREMQKIEVELDSMVDLLNYAGAGPVVWNSGVTPEDFAALVRDRINANTSGGVAHGWTAVTQGASVWFSPPAGTYAAGNGINCYYTKANISIAQPKAPAVGYVTKGGVAPVVGVNQVVTFRIAGTFNMRADYWLEIDGIRWSARGYDLDHPRTAIVHRSKVYAPTENMLYFSAIGAPRRWLSGVGAGYIGIENQSPDGDPIVALAPFGKSLAVFQPRGVQVWDLPEDEERAGLMRVVSSIGAVGGDAVLDVGGIDTLFLTTHGIRSLRARTLTDAPFVADIGAPVDAHIEEAVAAGDISRGDFAGARALVNPRDGRIWFLVGRDKYKHRVYVLSLYPETKVSAWSWYEFPIDIRGIAATSTRLFLRDAEQVYEYGGPTGNGYAEPGTTVYSVRTPYFAFGRPTVAKGEAAVDFVCTGRWTASCWYKPYDPYVAQLALGVVRSSDRGAGPIRLPVHETALAFELMSNEKIAGSLSQIVVYGFGLPKI